jgi:hypothetical protein
MTLRNEQLEKHTDICATSTLKTGNNPSYLTWNMDGDNLNDDDFKSLATMLQSGNAPQYLSLQIHTVRMSTLAVDYIAEALESGKCPKGLALNFNCKLRAQSIQRLLQAVQTGKCPEEFKLNLGKALNYTFNSSRFIIDDIIPHLNSEFPSKEYEISFGNDCFGLQAINSLIAALKKQKPANRYRLFVDDNDSASKRLNATVASLCNMYLLQKICLMMVGTQDPNSGLYGFNYGILNNITEMINSKLPVFESAYKSLVNPKNITDEEISSESSELEETSSESSEPEEVYRCVM